MFTGWRGVHHASSAIAGFSAVLGEDGLSVRTYTENFFSSHLDEAGEPWGATRGPQGRCGQPPDGSDGHGVAHPNLRGREGVNLHIDMEYQSTISLSYFTGPGPSYPLPDT